MAFWSRRPRNAPAWFARARRDDATSVTDKQFRHWLSEGPQNELRYEQLELIWTVAGELEQDPEIKTLLADLPNTSPRTETRMSSGKRLLLVSVACGLALLAIGLSARFSHQSERLQSYATRLGEERTIVLPDRSTMTLNTATRVTVSYAADHRTITLEQGEATFNVAHDAKRRFEVVAAGGSARALGTQFNVLASGKTITVAVLEGRVAVTAARSGDYATVPGTSLVLTGGEQVSYAGPHLDRTQPADIARIRGWHAGRIVLNNVELGAAIAEFNRYSAHPLQLGNPALLTHRITGVFRTGETDAFLDALQEAFSVHIERTNTAIILQ
jgi:transmembrane sensor